MADTEHRTPNIDITLTINGQSVTVPKGTLLVEAAKQVGVEIPVFCYHPKLKPVGACRMCLVEIEKMPRLQTACTTPVADGMAVLTNSPQVTAAQNGVIELLLANHPLDCPICDKGGECPLQDNAFGYGLGSSRFTESKRHLDKAYPLSERIVLDKERCIMCLRCVRFQKEIPGDEALTLVDRGGNSEVGVLPGDSFDSPFSGNTIELCPVGALTSRQYRFKARPWDLERTPSVCAGCAVGCNVEIHSRDGRILRLVSRDNPEVDDGWLCDYGRFDTLPAVAEHRVTEPLVRVNGELRPSTWEQALERAAELLEAGPCGVLASPSLTNEALWVLANALMPALATRHSPPGTQAAFWPQAAAPWPIEGQIASLPGCRSLLLVGLDPWKELPVLALWVRKATERGGRLVVIGPSNGLYRDTAHWLKVEAGREAETAAALLRCLTGEAGEAAPQVRASAEALAAGPAAVLAGPHVVRDEARRATMQALAKRLGANPANGGVRGAPSLAANGRGVLEIAPELAFSAADKVLDGTAVSEPTARAHQAQDGRAAARSSLGALLLVGNEAWPNTGSARLVQLASSAALEREGLQVVLPLAHAYEQAGSMTNLAGRVQQLQAGGFAPRQAKADWAALAALVAALGAELPQDLASIRTAMADRIPMLSGAR